MLWLWRKQSVITQRNINGVKRHRGILVKLAWLAILLPALPASACPDLADASHSRWRVETRQGVSWLITPCGESFFSVGVNVLTGGAPSRVDKGRVWYHWETFYSTFNAWRESTLRRLTDWGFNTAGGWSLPPQSLPWPSTPDLELGRTAQFHWFDPFHPDMAERMRAEARELTASYKGNPYRIGYFSDNEVGWWNGALFVYYIQRPPANHTKRRLVEMLRAHYENDWSRFLKDFVVPREMDSFEDLLQSQGVVARLRPGGEGIQAVRRWTGMVAGHYYRLARQAIKEADPDTLFLGDRLPIYYDPVAVRAMAPYVDVISTNYNADSPDGWIAPYFFDGLRRLSGNKPILISEWFFAARENRTGNLNNGHLMTVDTQSERARGAAAAARRFAGQPQVVGLHWFQFYDHPKGGRDDGEDYNFGLVDVNDQPYDELTAILGKANKQLAAVHQEASAISQTRTDGRLTIPKADINPADRSLADWPKEQALLPAPFAPEPEIPFGEFYLSWAPSGLRLAFIGMDYHDLDLLDYEGDFPLAEALRVDWGLDCGAGPRRYRLHVIPPQRDKATRHDSYNMHTRFCQQETEACEPVPGATVSYFGSDQPRITLELHLPWSAPGCQALAGGAEIRLELASTAFHRSRWMSLSGLPPADALRAPTIWRTAKLVE